MPNLVFQGTTVNYQECPGSPAESIAGGMFRSTRTFLVDWDQRWHFVAGTIGVPSLRADIASGETYLSRTVPEGYFSVGLGGILNRDWLFPTGIERVEGQGKALGYDASGTAYYEKAKVTVSYEAVTYSIRSDAEMVQDGYTHVDADGDEVLIPGEQKLGRYVTKFYMPTAEYLTLPFGGLNWAEAPLTPVPGSIGRIIAATEVMFIWHQVPAIPEAVHTHIGTVNNAAFPTFVSGNDRQFDRGTLLLTSIDVKPYRWFFNQRLYDITYKFKYFQPVAGLDTSKDSQNNNGIRINEPYGHNHFLRYKPGSVLAPSYQMLSHNGRRPLETDPDPGVTVYAYKDFAELFQLNVADEFR